MQLWAYPEPWPTLTSDDCFRSLEPGVLYWQTLGEVVDLAGAAGGAILRAASTQFNGPIRAVVAALNAWPVVYEVGKGRAMRWIRCTMRGTLGGGVETFQHKTDWGIPGADPDPDEAAQQVLADKFRAAWSTAIGASPGGGLLGSLSASVKYIEVGVVKMTQTDATDSGGGGGNVAQANDTVWSMWPGTTGPVGTATSPSLPFEVSCAVTLQSSKRGASGRGRLYLPPFSTIGMVADGRYGIGVVQAAGDSVGKFFTDAMASTGLMPVVVSQRLVELHPVLSVNVGFVPDAQRRRRRSQAEARSTRWTKPA